MSKISLKEKDNVGILELTVSPAMEEMFKQEPFDLGLEMLQGEKKILANGHVWYKLQITDPNKCAILREFTLQMINHQAGGFCNN